MLFDIAMKLARKSLSQGFYNKISYDLLGRRRNYERIGTYADIHRHYREHGISFQGKNVVEVGAGLQYFTALFFLADGASQVTLVEPKLIFSAEELRRTLAAFNGHASRPRPLTEAEVRDRIQCFRDLSEVPRSMDGQADLLCSFTVLEHVHDLPGFFSESNRILKPGGCAYHMVDLSDHTYQVFARFRLLSGLNSSRALYHLRYSPGLFGVLNDPKCYMNRVLMPAYLDLAGKNGFTIVRKDTQPYPGKVKIHPRLLDEGARDEEMLRITTLSLTLEKTGAAAAARGA